MEYPHIPLHISKEELFEHFTLTKDERYHLPQIWRKGKNILGFAVLLKTFSFLGFPPRKKEDIPAEIVSWILLDMKDTAGKAACGIFISPPSGASLDSGRAIEKTFTSLLIA